MTKIIAVAIALSALATSTAGATPRPYRHGPALSARTASVQVSKRKCWHPHRPVRIKCPKRR
jgi:hypothetical protein